jgi:hypothetical protein
MPFKNVDLRHFKIRMHNFYKGRNLRSFLSKIASNRIRDKIQKKFAIRCYLGTLCAGSGYNNLAKWYKSDAI